jgi:hypothetical protein
MRLVEFLHPLKGGPMRDLCLGALYYSGRYEGQYEVTVDELRSLLKRAHIPRAAKRNLADVLAKAAPFVETAGRHEGSFLWRLTTTGQDHVRSMLGFPEAEPEIEHDVSSLNGLISKISHEEVKDYLEEAIKCLSVGALRAAVVFLWAGAVRHLQQECMSLGAAEVDAAVRKHEPKVRKIQSLDDLAYVKESVLLLAAQELGIFDRNQRSTLSEALSLRNRAGHPGKYRPGEKKVSSFIEDVVFILFMD